MQNKLKQLVSTAPVLIKLDYDAAKLPDHLDPSPRPSDHGLVIVGVDSCQNGAGWILYQMVQREKHLVIFSSCTFSPTEVNYSQPKLELYGVFRAIKDLQHRIWGIHFQIDVDAKCLIEMVKQPDLPNAPMTRWISYIALFDYVMHHVPSQSHAAEDGLLRRRCTSEDSDYEDAEEYLDRFMGSAHPTLLPFSMCVGSGGDCCRSSMVIVGPCSLKCQQKPEEHVHKRWRPMNKYCSLQK